MKKEILTTIDAKSNDSLLRVASAMSEFQLMRKIGLERGEKEPESIKFAMDAILEVLSYKFQQIFVDEFPKYEDNKISLDFRNLQVSVFVEKYNDVENCEKPMDISEMLKNSGLETSDDHVERLADDLRNKKGGLA